MSARLSCVIPLPAAFRADDILAFHRRDAQEIAERVSASALHKGIAWAGAPARLAVRFHAAVAEAELAVDGDVPAAGEVAFATMVRRMLGLEQNIEAFENCHRGHPQLGALIARQPGLRVPVAATPFEALTWAVTGQQISVGAAVALRRKLIMATRLRHSSGLLCHPDAGGLAPLAEEELRQLGFSTTKARTLRALAQAVSDGSLPLDAWAAEVRADDIRARLLAVRGIGPWTVNYTLLRGFGWLDGSLHGDVAVRRSLQALLRSAEKISEQQAGEWLEEFSPWRALVAAHLWAARSAAAY
ncbi:MAG: AlkA N-terminal domain-containing protein [Rhodocyclaceae bacterium]|nr:AlkA N-terminal domain-containing protein [Rhodocyclaceae bacterium]